MDLVPEAAPAIHRAILAKLLDRSHGAVSARGGTYDTRDASAELALVRGITQFSAAGTSHETDGVLDFNNGYRNRHVSASLRIEPTARKGVRATIRRSPPGHIASSSG